MQERLAVLLASARLPILAGTGNSAIVYIVFTLSAAAMILVGILLGRMPGISIICLIPLLFALPVAPLAAQRIGQKQKLIPLMAVNVAITLLVPVLLALAMLTASGVSETHTDETRSTQHHPFATM